MAEAKKSETFALPEGRVTNSSVFVKDKYDEKAVPAYKIEIAIPGTPETNEELAALEDMLLEAADKHLGAGAGDDEDLVLPLLDGNKLKKKREKKGKEGGAYKDATIIRLSTIYNGDGFDAAGGIQVFDEDAERMEVARQGEFYNGCQAVVGCTIGFYEDRDGNNAIKLYLSAVQKVADGEKLISAADRSNLFSARGRKRTDEETGGRRRRRRSSED